MATNHTENYALNLWEANDKFVREEFNENTTKLDAAIKAEADARAAAVTAETNARTAAVNTLTQTVAGKAQIAVGAYYGNGTDERMINVGATPKAVLLFDSDGYSYIPSTGSGTAYVGGLALPGYPAGDCGTYGTTVEIVTNGFKVRYYSGNFRISSNQGGRRYHYIAFI